MLHYCRPRKVVTAAILDFNRVLQPCTSHSFFVFSSIGSLLLFFYLFFFFLFFFLTIIFNCFDVFQEKKNIWLLKNELSNDSVFPFSVVKNFLLFIFRPIFSFIIVSIIIIITIFWVLRV